MNPGGDRISYGNVDMSDAIKMVVEREGTFVVDGKSLYMKTWLPDGHIRAKLIFIHGYSDHIGRYYDFFPSLARRAIAVYSWDQRGWGRSVQKPSEMGLTGPTKRVLKDIVAFLTPHLPPSPQDPPVFVLGHSMGGGEALTLACDPDYEHVTRRVRGWLLEAPLIGFSPGEKPSTMTMIAGRVVGRVLPHRHMYKRMAPINLSRDPEVVRSLEQDKLCHSRGTLEGLAGMLDRTKALQSGKVRPRVGVVQSLWIGHGTMDKGTSYDACKKYFDEYTLDVKDRTFTTYDGWYHQLHADGPCSREFYDDVAGWILERSKEGKGMSMVEAKL